jgi:hypothetical protein
MQFLKLSVRSLLILVVTTTLFSFRFDNSPVAAAALIAGKWDCGSRSGQLDENTSYQLSCAGDVNFKSDHSVESTTTDAFFPSGSVWKVVDNKIVLCDSFGAVFVDFEIKLLESKELILMRKGVEYGFHKAD